MYTSEENMERGKRLAITNGRLLHKIVDIDKKLCQFSKIKIIDKTI